MFNQKENGLSALFARSFDLGVQMGWLMSKTTNDDLEWEDRSSLLEGCTGCEQLIDRLVLRLTPKEQKQFALLKARGRNMTSKCFAQAKH